MDSLAGKGFVEGMSVKGVVEVSGRFLSSGKGQRIVTSVALRWTVVQPPIPAARQ